MKWNSKKLEDAIISHKFKHNIVRRLVRQVEYSVTGQDWSHLKKRISETAQEMFGQRR
jgi:hypothetical protein